jgi:hypothetical protein
MSWDSQSQRTGVLLGTITLRLLLLSVDPMRPELDNVLQCLSLNGYSVSSLIDDILACCDREDRRIQTVREGIEHECSDEIASPISQFFIL